MIVVNIDEVMPDAKQHVSLKTLFSERDLEGANARFGVVTIPPKTRIPLSGTGAHEEDEYSIVVKGAMIAGVGDMEYRLSAGDASLIPAGEAHWAYNDGEENCEIVWVLVRR
ncbi:cupin domain-containing protein [Brevibacillus humidisoli]|uniref:cupin domain-containing protein n=1 Tax=Brevibacillus humidisoli TaxID=2895522 RepID=UPI001E5B5FFE|nr:cupin domain-containing protein [Brevibacillus humidisoli]UFJ42399.1 cupin domain-containing protein [Brevibacillus humidisoli]